MPMQTAVKWAVRYSSLQNRGEIQAGEDTQKTSVERQYLRPENCRLPTKWIDTGIKVIRTKPLDFLK